MWELRVHDTQPVQKVCLPNFQKKKVKKNKKKEKKKGVVGNVVEEQMIIAGLVVPHSLSEKEMGETDASGDRFNAYF